MSEDVLKKCKHRQVYEYVYAAIIDGKYKAGDQIPTDAQLMKMFDASRPTVARAMRDLENAGFLERRAGSGSFVKVPAQVTPSLIGLLIPELGEAELFEPICSEIARTCQKHNLSLVWSDASRNEKPDATTLCERYIQQGVAGVFFAPVEFNREMISVNREIAERLDAAGITVVLLDRDFERMPKRSRFDLVAIDNFRAGFTQCEYLLGLGSKRICYVTRPISAPSIDARIAGYQQALQAHEITPVPEWVFRGNPDRDEFVQEILQAKPDAIVCSNDTTAAILLQAMQRNGVVIPDDIRLIGLDDVRYASLLGVPLTTLHQPCKEIGDAAVTAMVQRLENRNMPTRDILLDVKLVVRESCGGKKPTRKENADNKEQVPQA